MYLSHYHLEKSPFKTSPDPTFLWLGEKHKEAFALLQYGLVENEGMLLLSGEAGTGKTTMINFLLNTIGDSALTAVIPDPVLSPPDFLRFLALEFNLSRKFKTKGDFLVQFKQFLLEAEAADKKVLLIIDEAQSLYHALLEQIRLLSNIERDDRKLISIFLVGQNEIMDKLLKEKNRAVRQRITASYHIEALSRLETHQYIEHRLKVAGAKENIFTPEASAQVFAASEGIPRLINTICDCALLIGYVRDLTVIDEDVINECQKDLNVPIGIMEKEKPQITITEDDAVFLPQIPKAWLIVLFAFLFGLTAYLLFIVMAD